MKLLNVDFLLFICKNYTDKIWPHAWNFYDLGSASQIINWKIKLLILADYIAQKIKKIFKHDINIL